MANGLFGGGSGTDISPYIIEDYLDFRQIGKHTTSNGRYYVLANDIDCINEAPLADFLFYGAYAPHINGKNHTIRNLVIKKTGQAALCQLAGGSFKNLVLEDCHIESTDQKEAASFAVVTSVGIIHNLRSRRVTVIGGVVAGIVMHGTNQSQLNVAYCVIKDSTIKGSRVAGITNAAFGTIANVENSSVDNCDLISTGDAFGISGVTGGYGGKYSKCVASGRIYAGGNAAGIGAMHNGDSVDSCFSLFSSVEVGFDKTYYDIIQSIYPSHAGSKNCHSLDSTVVTRVG